MPSAKVASPAKAGAQVGRWWWQPRLFPDWAPASAGEQPFRAGDAGHRQPGLSEATESNATTPAAAAMHRFFRQSRKI